MVLFLFFTIFRAIFSLALNLLIAMMDCCKSEQDIDCTMLFIILTFYIQDANVTYIKDFFLKSMVSWRVIWWQVMRALERYSKTK